MTLGCGTLTSSSRKRAGPVHDANLSWQLRDLRGLSENRLRMNHAKLDVGVVGWLGELGHERVVERLATLLQPCGGGDASRVGLSRQAGREVRRVVKVIVAVDGSRGIRVDRDAQDVVPA